jgi:hypothetical protein
VREKEREGENVRKHELTGILTCNTENRISAGRRCKHSTQKKRNSDAPLGAIC